MENELLEILKTLIDGQKSLVDGQKSLVDGQKEITDRLGRVENKITNIELTLENDVKRDIKIVAEGHLDLSRKLDITQATINHIDSKLDVHELIIKNNIDAISQLKKIG